MCSVHVTKAHFTREAHITSAGNITFRLRNTSLKKDGYFSNRLFSGSPERMYAFVGIEPDIIAPEALTVISS